MKAGEILRIALVAILAVIVFKMIAAKSNIGGLKQLAGTI